MGRFVAALLLVAACDGTIGQPAGRGGAGDRGGPGAFEEEDEFGDAFALPRDRSELLPFAIRLRKVADVVGVGEEDALLEPLRTRRIELGDSDYARGVAADRTWLAARMSIWIDALRPVCTSEAMHARYPALPGDLPALLEAAWGRPVAADELAAFTDPLAATSLDDDARYEVLCLAALSSAEFVVQP